MPPGKQPFLLSSGEGKCGIFCFFRPRTTNTPNLNTHNPQGEVITQHSPRSFPKGKRYPGRVFALFYFPSNITHQLYKLCFHF